MRFILFFVLLSAGLNAQQIFLGHAIQFTPEDAPVKKFNLLKYRISLLEKYKNTFADEVALHDFVETITETKRSYLYSNFEFEQWDSATVYLEKILNKLSFEVPFDFKPAIKIVRDASVGSCAFEDGTIYINSGLIAMFDSEAELAAILGHEIGHVLKGHSYENYKTQKDYYKIVGPFLGRNVLGVGMMTKSFSERLITNEEESDAISVKALNASGYNGSALNKVFTHFINNSEKQYEKKGAIHYGGSYLKTHPNPEDRLKKALRSNLATGKNFLVDSAYFMRLKQQCTDENINLLFEQLDFDDCIELAFVEHLKSPNDPFYLFYLAESTRRLVEKNKTLANENFITYRYDLRFGYKKPLAPIPFVYTNNRVAPYKKSFNTSVFYRLHGILLDTDSADLALFKKTTVGYGDTLPFITNADALDYLKRKNNEKGFWLNNLFLNYTGDSLHLTKKEKQFNSLRQAIEQYKTQETDNKVLWIVFNVTRTRKETVLSGTATGHSSRGMSSSKTKTIYNMQGISSKTIGEAVEPLGALDYLITCDSLSYSDNSRIGMGILNIVSPLISKTDLTAPESPFVKSTTWETLEKKTKRQVVQLNIDVLMPEVVYILKKYNYKGIMFSTHHISEQLYKGGLGDILHEFWHIEHYYLDFKKNEVTYSYTRLYNKTATGFLEIENNSTEGLYYLYNKTLRAASK